MITALKEKILNNLVTDQSVVSIVIDGSQSNQKPIGSRDIVEKAIEAHRGMLSSWLTKKLGNRDVAEDIAQQAFVKALNYSTTTIVDNPKALLFKIAANLTMNEYRRRNQEALHFVQIDDTKVIDGAAAHVENQFSPEQQAGDRQKLRQVKHSFGIGLKERLIARSLFY